MDSLEITRELNKIHGLHSSLDETNILTYIIFAATFETKLSPAQHEWIDNRIAFLKSQTDDSLVTCLSKLDSAVTSLSLLEKMETAGYQSL